jgi:outer membrane protein assembly factor BamB
VVTLGVSGVLSCLDAGTGKLLWRNSQYEAVPQFFTATSPIIVDGMAILHLGGKGSGAVVAFDPVSGEQKWKWTGDAPTYASPALMTADGTRQLVQQTDKNLVGLALADGRLLWKIPTPTQGRFYSSATPIVDGQTVIYTGQGTGTKAVKIEKQGDDFAVKELWSNDKLGTGFNTPVLRDGLLFGLSDRSNFFCLDAKSGQTLWTDEAKRGRFGAIVDAGSVLLALPEKSGLIAFKPSDKQYEELAKIKVSDGPIYAHPVVSGRRIFIKDRSAVTLWTVE